MGCPYDVSKKNNTRKMDVQAYYSEKLKHIDFKLNQLTSKVLFYSLTRLALFFVGILTIYYCNNNLLMCLVLVGIELAIFVKTVHLFLNAKEDKLYFEAFKQIVENEIKGLQGDFKGIDAGVEFQDPTHAYSSDLDLFVPNGLFAMFNKTSTERGKNELASALLNGIDTHQKSNALVQELTNHLDWMMEFRTRSSIETRLEGAKLSVSNFQGSDFYIKKWMRIYCLIVPFYSFSSLLLLRFDKISFSTYILFTIIGLFPTMKQLKLTNLYAKHTETYESTIKILVERITLIRELQLKSEVFASKIEGTALTRKNDEALHQVLKGISRLSMRLNVLVGIVLNVFLAWDLRQRLFIQKWTKQNFQQICDIETQLSQLEVTISAAIIRIHYPETSFAKFQADDCKSIEVDSVIHPLIAHENPISNSLHFTESEHFLILTGPNMAGKSTFLRSIGIALMSARAGFPVFAKSMNSPLLQLYSSMRNADDINSHSSYFYAELSRLKKVMEGIELSKGQMFVLLDEILKGTNSKDKQEGSEKYLNKLRRIGGKGIIATHDLSLCNLSQQDAAFTLGYFDSTISDDELHFDYQLREGICQQMNASFLLKQMNLVD